MVSNFDRWEKDPFFSAAEEVQESTDRMESAYRTWIRETKSDSRVCDPEELRRDVHTALGTAKWQLEEFDRAVRSSYVDDNSAKDAKTRHCQFIAAISNQIAVVENSLRDSAIAEGKPSLPWVKLDQVERDELALFLLGLTTDREFNSNSTSHFVESGIDDKEEDIQKEVKKPEFVKDLCQSIELTTKETPTTAKEEDKSTHGRGHRRTASANADMGVWKIAVGDESLQRSSVEERPEHLPRPPPRVVSFSGFLSSMDQPLSKIKLSKNGFRKWKLSDRHQASDTIPLHNDPLSRGINICYERSKSCLDSCDDSYDKQLYGCLGAVQRQLQRSQYQIQYSRPLQLVFWIIVVFFLIVVFALRAI